MPRPKGPPKANTGLHFQTNTTNRTCVFISVKNPNHDDEILPVYTVGCRC